MALAAFPMENWAFGGKTGKVGGRDPILCETLQVKRRILVFSFNISGRLIKARIRKTI